MTRAAWVVLAGLSAALASGADPDPALVLQRLAIKARVRANTLPNYTCVQTVTRDFYRPKATSWQNSCPAALDEHPRPAADPDLRLVMTDRLRLDVTLTEKGEIYSWAGASKFEDAGIDAVVHQGPISTGSFGALLAVVFAQDSKTFRYEGTTREGSRTLMEYRFQTAKEDSRYKVRASDGWAYTGYTGSVQVDADAMEVVRMTLQTAVLPESTGACRTASEMEFSMVRIGDGEFPLPKAGVQHFIDRDGSEAQNTTTFAACREYRGESTITFSPPADAGDGKGGSGPATGPAAIPPDLPFTFELTTPISGDTAAGGDSFSGRLVSTLRDKGKTIAPAHALVEGRLLRVEIHRTQGLGANFVLRLRTVEVGGVKIPLAAERRFERPAPGRRAVPILLPYSWEEHSGVFPVQGSHPAMKAGTRLEWVTR